MQLPATLTIRTTTAGPGQYAVQGRVLLRMGLAGRSLIPDLYHVFCS